MFHEIIIYSLQSDDINVPTFCDFFDFLGPLCFHLFFPDFLILPIFILIFYHFPAYFIKSVSIHHLYTTMNHNNICEKKAKLITCDNSILTYNAIQHFQREFFALTYFATYLCSVIYMKFFF